MANFYLLHSEGLNGCIEKKKKNQIHKKVITHKKYTLKIIKKNEASSIIHHIYLRFCDFVKKKKFYLNFIFIKMQFFLLNSKVLYIMNYTIQCRNKMLRMC